MSQTPSKSKITAKDAIRELWSRGILTYKLHPIQKKMLQSYIDQNQEVTTILCSRRLGKSFLLCLLAVEKCIQKPKSIVKYVCPRKNMVKTILQPIMEQILIDCPTEMRPVFKYNDSMYVFPNGSLIQMAGTDNGHHENLRGGKSDMWIVDEAGFCDELTYVVNTILAPTADTTGGRGIIASTPSKTSDHEFITDFLRPAEFNGTLIKYTIYDNPLITEDKIRAIIDRYPLKEKDPEFRREYLCEVINGGDLSVIPEFTDEIQAEVIKEWVRPAFYDAYVSMDIGFRDLTVVLFGYYDFKNGLIVIEDEIAQSGSTLLLDKFAKDIRDKEEKLWTNPMSGEFKPPYLRVADNNNLIMLNQLSINHGIQFVPTRKDNKEAALNTLRMKIANKQIIIHPRCKTLIYHLRNASWNKARKEFERSPDAGHYDAVDSLIYLVRNVVETRNPYPPSYAGADTFIRDRKKDYTPNEKAWIQIFKTRTSLK